MLTVANHIALLHTLLISFDCLCAPCRDAVLLQHGITWRPTTCHTMSYHCTVRISTHWYPLNETNYTKPCPSGTGSFMLSHPLCISSKLSPANLYETMESNRMRYVWASCTILQQPENDCATQAARPDMANLLRLTSATKLGRWCTGSALDSMSIGAWFPASSLFDRISTMSIGPRISGKYSFSHAANKAEQNSRVKTAVDERSRPPLHEVDPSGRTCFR